MRVPTSDTRLDPRQPSRLEKNKSTSATSARRWLVGHVDQLGTLDDVSVDQHDRRVVRLVWHLVAEQDARTLARRRAAVAPDCAFSTDVRVGRATRTTAPGRVRLSVSVRYIGDAELEPVSAGALTFVARPSPWTSDAILSRTQPRHLK
jgi:hypothetical protein